MAKDKSPKQDGTQPVPAGLGQENGEDTQLPPSMQILAQYTKDFSFENPFAPESLMEMDSQPEVEIGINVGSKEREAGEFEVDLHLEVKAKSGDKSVFAVELVYGGVFKVDNVPDEMLHPIVHIECPRMLFPFARQILSEAIRDGGFPPLMLDPIDFGTIYQQRMAQEQQDEDGPA